MITNNILFYPSNYTVAQLSSAYATLFGSVAKLNTASLISSDIDYLSTSVYRLIRAYKNNTSISASSTLSIQAGSALATLLYGRNVNQVAVTTTLVDLPSTISPAFLIVSSNTF